MTPSADAQTSPGTSVPAPGVRWGSRVLLPAALVAGFAALFAGTLLQSVVPVVEVETAPVVQRPSIRLATAPANVSEAEAVVQAAGWIEPDPFPTYATALTNGIVDKVHFLEGDTVEAGDVLARFIDDDARLALQRAEAEFRAAEEAWVENVDATREAAVATAAVRETAAMLRQARAELQREQALLANALRIQDRVASLLKDEVRTQQEFDTAEADALALAARVDMARGRISELEAMLTRMEAEEAAAKKRLELRTEERQRLDLARVALAEAQLRFERMDIVAPISGVVMERFVEPGSMMMAFSENAAMARAASLYDPSRLQVRVDVPLADAAKVGAGQRAMVVVEVLPDRIFAGYVSRVTNHADIQKNTLEVKVALDEPSPLLKPDMLARVRFMAAPESGDTEPVAGNSVFAPVEAIEDGRVWVVSGFDGKEGRAAKRDVSTTGAVDAGWAEIESGLRPGDLLIVSGRQALGPGQRVRVRNEGGA